MQPSNGSCPLYLPPKSMEIVEYTVSELANTHTIQHHIGSPISFAFIFPKIEPTRMGMSAPISFYCVNATGGTSDYPYKNILNFRSIDGNWDYTGSNNGWTSDANNLTLYFGTDTRFPVGDYYVIIYKY